MNLTFFGSFSICRTWPFWISLSWRGWQQLSTAPTCSLLWKWSPTLLRLTQNVAVEPLTFFLLSGSGCASMDWTRHFGCPRMQQRRKNSFLAASVTQAVASTQHNILTYIDICVQNRAFDRCYSIGISRIPFIFLPVGARRAGFALRLDRMCTLTQVFLHFVLRMKTGQISVGFCFSSNTAAPQRWRQNNIAASSCCWNH